MASVYRRRRNGKREPFYTIKYVGIDGRWHTAKGVTDRRASEEIGRKLETDCRLVREGVVEPGEKVRREAALKPLDEHLDDYRDELVARGNTAGHIRHTIGVLRRLLKDAGIDSVARLSSDRIQAAIGRLRARRSARTANHARGAIIALAWWLYDAGRIREMPKGVRKLRRFNEEADRRRVRRALSIDELARLIAAAEAGPEIEAFRGKRGAIKTPGTLVTLSGPDRAWIYRLAAETGLRANEIRTLTRASFDLSGKDPAVIVQAAYSKHRRKDRQPVRKAFVPELKRWLKTRPADGPVVPVPTDAAGMLKRDLDAAGVEYRTADGVADFHALRAMYITNLWRAGVNPKLIQKLARHSTITLTLDTYTKATDDDVREALDRKGGDS